VPRCELYCSSSGHFFRRMCAGTCPITSRVFGLALPIFHRTHIYMSTLLTAGVLTVFTDQERASVCFQDVARFVFRSVPGVVYDPGDFFFAIFAMLNYRRSLLLFRWFLFKYIPHLKTFQTVRSYTLRNIVGPRRTPSDAGCGPGFKGTNGDGALLLQ
jgi:hypothetical protein